MKSNVTEFLKQDVAAHIREAGFSKFDATTYSKVNNPDYGIKLVPKAKQAEIEFYVENGLKLPQDRGKHIENPDYPRTTVRMPVEQYLVLQEQMKKQGIYTMNLIINKAITTALEIWK